MQEKKCNFFNFFLVLLHVCIAKYRFFHAHIDIYFILVDYYVMTGLTIDEMCEKLKLPFKTVEARIQRAGIKPLTKQALYPCETLDIIKDVTMGRPKKTANQKSIKTKTAKQSTKAKK
jgi:hypothetical protein